MKKIIKYISILTILSLSFVMILDFFFEKTEEEILAIALASGNKTIISLDDCCIVRFE
jgi:hypothetical protein